MNEREQQYIQVNSPHKYANESVGARVGLMVRGGCLLVRGSKVIEWKYDDELLVWDKRNRYTCGCQVQML